MHNPSAQSKSKSAYNDPLQRGRFSDGIRIFTVCASSAEAPDSFQVYADENRADLVLIVSGLTTGNLHATWGEEWRSAAAEYQKWARISAFQVFYNGRVPEEVRADLAPAQGKARFCDG